jgi:hypothetical protein
MAKGGTRDPRACLDGMWMKGTQKKEAGACHAMPPPSAALWNMLSGALGRAGRGRCLGATAVAGAGCAPASPSSGSTAFWAGRVLLPAHRTVTSVMEGLESQEKAGIDRATPSGIRKEKQKTYKKWHRKLDPTFLCTEFTPGTALASRCKVSVLGTPKRKRYLTFVPVRGIGW